MKLMTAVLTFACTAFAGRAEQTVEAQKLVDGVLNGTAQVNQALNRIRFAGAEAWASHHLTKRLPELADPRLRSAALELLAAVATSDSSTESLLEAASLEGETFDRMNAVNGLGRMRRKSSLDTLQRLLDDKAVGVRSVAAKAVGAIGEAKTCRRLLDIAKSEPETAARSEQLRAIGQCQDKKLVAGLSPFLKSDSELTRLAATQALCRLNAPAGFASVKTWLTSSDETQRLLGVQLFEGFKASAAESVLSPMLRDSDTKVSATAARILAQGGSSAATLWLLAQSESASGDDKARFETEIERLMLPDDVRTKLIRQMKAAR